MLLTGLAILLAACVTIWLHRLYRRQSEFPANPGRLRSVRPSLQERASESEQRYSQLVNNCPQAIAIHVDGRFVFVNSAMVRMFGFASQEEMLGLVPEELLAVRHREAARERNRILTMAICSLEAKTYDFLRADGSTFCGEIHPTSIAIGGRIGVQSLIVDVTERQESEDRLRESEEKYRALTENSPLAISIHSNGLFMFVNARMAEMFGYDNPQDMIGQAPIDHFCPRYQAQAHARYQKLHSEFQCLEPEVFEFIRRDGSSFMGEIHSKTIDIQGQRYVQAMITDISDRVDTQIRLASSEQRFRQFMNSSSEYIWCISFDPLIDTGLSVEEQVRQVFEHGRISEANQQTARYFGVQDISDVLDRPLREIYPPELLGQAITLFQDFVEADYRLADIEEHCVDEQGKPLILLTNTQSVVREGKLSLVWVVSRDVTETLQMRDQLQASEKRYRALTQQSSEAIWRIEFTQPIPLCLPVQEQVELFFSSGVLTDCNDLMAQYFGKEDASQVRGRTLRNLQIDFGMDLNHDRAQRFIESGYRSADEKINVPAADGGVRIYLENSTGVVEDDCLLAVWGTTRDVTENLRMHEQLLASEKRFRELTEQSSEAIWRIRYDPPVPVDLPVDRQVEMIRSNGIIEDCNDLMAGMYGLREASQVRGCLVSDLLRESGLALDPERTRHFIRAGYSFREEKMSLDYPDGGRRVYLDNADGLIVDGRLVEARGTSREVTEQMRVQDELVDSERRFRQLVDKASEGIWCIEYDPPIPVDLDREELIRRFRSNGVLSECNELMARLYGVDSADSIRGRPVSEVAAISSLKPTSSRISRLIDNNYILRDEVMHLEYRDGTQRVYLYNADGLIVDKRLTTVWGTSRDVTEYVRVEQQLRESEQRYRDFVANSSEAIWRYDCVPPIPTGLAAAEQAELMYERLVIAECNDEFARIYGLGNAAAAAGTPISRLVPRERGLLDMFERYVRNGYSLVDGEDEITPHSERSRFFLNSAQGTLVDGQQVMVWGTTREITEQRLASLALADSEKRNRELILTMAEGLIQVDSENRIRIVTPNGCSILGRSEDELLGRTLMEFVAQNDRDVLLEQQRSRRQGLTSAYEMDILRPDGSRRRISITGCPQFDEQGTYSGSLGTFQDVTETRQLARQLQQAQKMEAVGVLAGGIAHDFNNILQAMLGFADLASDQLEPGSDAVSCLAEIRAAGNRAAELVRQMLTFSRQSEEAKIPVDISAIVHESVGLLRGSLPSTISIITNIKDTDAVLGNATQFQQVIMNLSTNAFHAMRERGGVLEISCHNLPCSAVVAAELGLQPGSPMVELRVRDTGHGMDPETTARVFDPYFTTKRIGEGTGLGLATVHGIVRLLGGWIGIDSEAGNGTCFTILLPSQSSSASPASRSVRQSQPVEGDELIMIVDDEPAIAQMLNAGLSRYGYRTESFTDSREAWNFWLEHRDTVDLVVTDQTMPFITGDELSRRMLAQRPGLPVLLCTGYSDLIDELGAEKLGISRFINKPIVPSQLATLIRECLDGRILTTR